MKVYIINLLLILVYAFISKMIYEMIHEFKTDNNISTNVNMFLIQDQKGLIILVSLQLFIISAFKDLSVGIDMVNYNRGFNEIATRSWSRLTSYSWETGYVLLNKVVQIFTSDFRAIIVIVSLVITVLIGLYIHNESSSPWLSFYLFITMGFFNSTLNIYRQSMAMTITIYSLKYVRERNLLKFIITVLIATLFHKSALVFLIVYPISRIKIDRTYILTMSAVGVMVFLFGDKVISILLSLYDRNQSVVSGQGLGMLTMLLVITVTGLLFYKYVKLEDPNVSMFCHIMILATFLQTFSYHLSIFVRVVSYFSIHMIVFIPNILRHIPSKILRILGTLGVIVVGFLYYLFILSGNASGTVPYNFMW